MLYTMFHWTDTGHLLPKKIIFNGFYYNTGVVAILVMWSGQFEQTFVPPSHGGSTWTGFDWLSVYDEMFEEWTTDDRGLSIL